MKLKLISILITFWLSSYISSAQTGCPTIDITTNGGNDIVLPCDENCTDLETIPFHAGQTTNYTVGSIPHTPPMAYNAAGGTAVSVGTDDVWCDPIALPFPFCFYGQTYNTCTIGSNGAIDLGSNNAQGNYHPWGNPGVNLPDPHFNANNIGDIFGVYQDIDPSINGTVKWYLTGTAPCRTFIVVFNELGHYSCNTLRTSSMMVMYETTNVIEVYVKQRDRCATWAGGYGLIGIQGNTTANGIAAPGRNVNDTWNVGTANSEAWQFVPNGAPIYTLDWYNTTSPTPNTSIGNQNNITVCPNGTDQTYKSVVTYTRCDGLVIVEEDLINVTYDNLPMPSINPTAESCNNFDDGSVIIDNAPGSGPYTVVVSGPVSPTFVEPNTAAGNATFNNLPDGDYTFTVTSANGCTYDGVFTIGIGPDCCSVTTSGTDLTCNNNNSGTVTAIPVGLAPYSYSWATGGQTSQTATGLAAGTYTVTMTDASGCIATDTQTIDEPVIITANATPTDVNCFNACDGQISISAPTGGTAPFQYAINAGALGNSGNFNSLCDGTYNVMVEDNNGCQLFLNSIVIVQPTDLTLAETANTPATCGQANGNVTVLATEGTAPYTYTLGGTTNATGTFSSLTSGNYTVTVTDDNLCTETVNITIDNAAGPIPSLDAFSNVACAGGLNGSATITTVGGTGPYQYSLDGGAFQASNTFVLAAGNYTVTVQDVNLCTGDVTFDIVEPAPLTFTATPTDALCFGDCNGIIDITINTPLAQQAAPYTYSSDNGLTFQGSNSLIGLCAGNINVVVKDNNGCLANVTTPIGEPSLLTSGFTFVEPSCFGVCDAQINITPTNGGTTPYLYSIDNGTTFNALPNFTNQCAGTFDIIVEDDNGCQVAMNGSTVTSPVQIDFNFLAVNPSNCGSPDGSFEIEAFNGTPAYTYSIDGGVTTQPSGVFTNLFSGNYTLSVTDINGCTESTFSSLSDIQMTSAVNGTQDVTCFNGDDGIAQVSVTAGGVAPITFELSTLATGYVSPPQASGLFLNLSPGLHAITVSDNGSCVNVVQITILEPDTILFDVAGTQLSCPTGNGAADGTITFSNVTGGNGVGGGALGGPYEYSIDAGANYQASPTFNGLTAGTYTTYVRDGNGCEGQSTITLTEPNPFDIVNNITPLTCNGNNTGFVQVVASGATAPYSFDLNGTTNTTGIYATLASNPAYNLTVTDDNNCVFTTTIDVPEPTLITATYVSTPANCNAVCDGEIEVTANGGIPTYLYSADNGVTYQSSNILTGLCAGTHTVIVKDDNDCTIAFDQPVTEPTALVINLVSTPTTCGNDNGTIEVTANGGTPVYEYSSDNGVTFVAGNIFTNLPVNIYDVVIKDDLGCEITDQITIDSENSPNFISVAHTDLLCNGDANATITSTANGGTGALTYDIGGAGQANGDFIGLSAGVYTLTVTDINLCTSIQTITILEPNTLSHTENTSDLLCFNDDSGIATITVDAINIGTAPYTYSFNNGTNYGNTNTADYLSAGDHTLIVQDANGCLSTSLITLTEPTELAVLPQSSNDASCFGYDDANATVNIDATTGTGPYNYSWSAPGIGNVATANNLTAGGYVVDITDNNGCVLQETFVIGEPLMVTISSVAGQNVSCNGGNDGEIVINALNVVNYSVDNGATFSTTSTFNGLLMGDYDIVVENINGCQQTYPITLEEPTPVVLNPISPIQICYEGDGTLLASASGGTAPYHLVWEATDTTSSYVVNSAVAMSATCIAYDLNGCASPAQVGQVTVPNGPFTIDANSINQMPAPICLGDSISITPNGLDGWQFPTAPDYIFHLIDDNQDTLTEVTPFIYTPPAIPGTYVVTVIGHDDCYRFDSLDVTITVNEVPQPTFVVDPSNGCVPHTPTFTNTTVGDMTGATLVWDFGNGNTITGSSPISTVYDVVDCYDVTLEITTATGCYGVATYDDIVCVHDNPVANFYFDPATPTTADQNIEFFNISENASTYQWTFGDYGSSFEENPFFQFNIDVQTTMEICLIATSDMGCIDEVCQPLTIYEELLFYVPNVFTPDGDDFNEIFKPVFTSGFDPYDYHLIIFNRWGEVMFESYDASFGWNGAYTNELVQDGVYIWQVEFGSLINDKREKHRGHVTLLK